LDILGDKVFHLGPVGAGQTGKLVNQMLSGGTMALIGEAMSLAKAAGLDLTQVSDVISGSSGNSTMFSSRAQFVMDDHYPPGFKTELMRKDVALALSLAHELHSPAPMASVALQQYTSTVRRGDGTLDFSAVARLWEDKPG
jgi:3-hydroxyisobutyrate dehydrogenase-like beta-hydroxyacid dehydrogenase